ncbi:Rpr2-domain-containing protein [Neocallimastix lanati (nom. inval.)]|jgi:RNase P subunit RPR2|nr:Rpr2-domain-containing protein [Neocallimastix sp. JGI-2020a]
MGRKAKNNISKATSLTESNIRMNFLYQASNLLATKSKEIQSNKNPNKMEFNIDKKKVKKNSTNNTNKKQTKDKIINKRKRVSLRTKRNKHISDLYKNVNQDDSTDINTMDIDNTPSKIQNIKLNSITNKNYPLLPLARYYNSTLSVVAQKTVSRMDPNVKRSICKCCKTPLIPGLTSDINVDDNEVKYEIVCKSCHTKREFKSDNPDYCLFTEKAALTPDIYEKYLEELSKENKKEKKSKK